MLIMRSAIRSRGANCADLLINASDVGWHCLLYILLVFLGCLRDGNVVESVVKKFLIHGNDMWQLLFGFICIR